MQPQDRTNSHAGGLPKRAGEPRTAEIIRLDEWRRSHRRQDGRRRGAAPPLPLSPAARTGRRRIPIAAWLMVLVLFSAAAGAVFALMALGYLP